MRLPILCDFQFLPISHTESLIADLVRLLRLPHVLLSRRGNCKRLTFDRPYEIVQADDMFDHSRLLA